MEFNKNVQVRQERFGAVIFETLKEKVFVTNPAGNSIIERLKEKKSPEAIVAELAVLYGTEPAEIADDVNCFIESLIAKGVLVK